MDLNDLKYITEKLGRKPNDVEIGMFENLWSEHCSYRSTKNILKKFAKTIKDNQNIVVGPGDDGAIIKIDDKTNLCIVLAMESHNHPSYIDPYNGAATGVGGIVRDIISMNSKPICLLDSLRFGDVEGKEGDKIRWLIDGVVRGIGDYGNRIGVPTVGGECEFDESYNYNNLVNVVCVGLVNEDKIIRGKATEPNLSLILVGSTGRDGIGGASFASKDLTSESDEDRPSVQIGDAFTEKCLIDAVLEACETGKVKGMKDLGAAGITSSCSEMCYSGGVGAELYLENVICREDGMTPYEIMVSESQERMLLAVESGSEEEIIKIFEKYELPASVIGKTIDTKKLISKMNGEVVVDLPLDLLCEAILIDREMKEAIYETDDDLERIKPINDLNEVVLKLLGSPNIMSKRWIYEQYDHEVQIRTVIKPGKDASVLRLMKCYPKGLGLTVDCNPSLCYLNPYYGSLYTVCESVRNLATVGAKPVAMLDNLNFGNPERPERMYQIVKCVEGLADAAEFFNIPVVGGNVSLYNETIIDGKDYPIKPTPTISIVGIVENVEKVPSVFNHPSDGDVVIITEKTTDEMGGCEYYRYIHNYNGGKVPKVDLEREKEIYSKVVDLINREIIKCAVDVSRGGLGIALSKLCINENVGLDIDLTDYNNNLRKDILLFSESSGRIILIVDKNNADYVVNEIKGYVIGVVNKNNNDNNYNNNDNENNNTNNKINKNINKNNNEINKIKNDNKLIIKLNNEEIINLSVNKMKEVYENAFPKMMGEL